jgi:phosphonopyruvate decarboxylase
LDGDGALLMHMGNLTTIGHSGCKNINHILINNGWLTMHSHPHSVILVLVNGQWSILIYAIAYTVCCVLVYIIGAHDSVGGQPTVGFKTDFCAMARATGYKFVATASTPEEIKKALQQLRSSEGPGFLEIKVNKGARKNLGRPKTSPLKNKEDFMKFLET